MDSTLQDDGTVIIADLSNQNITYEKIPEGNIVQEVIPKELTEAREIKILKSKTIFRCCYVPECKNNTEVTPNKTFFNIPPKNKDEWIKAAGIERKLPAGFLFVCEDHLDLQEDIENYESWKSTKCKPKLKPRVPKLIRALQPQETPTLYEVRVEPYKSEQQIVKKPKLETINNNSPEINKQMVGNLEPEIILNENWANKGPNTEGTTPQIIHDANIIVLQEEAEHQNLQSELVKNKSAVVCNKANEVPEQSANIIPLDDDILFDIPPEDDSGKDLSGRLFLLTNIEINPVFYLGVPEHAYWIIEHISRNQLHLQLSVIITLFKIKNDDAFIRLCDEFQVSHDTLRSMYGKTIKAIANFLMPLITWPSEPAKITSPPIRFLNENKEFVNIQCILDCYEIEIDKPLDQKRVIPIWSAEKNCPTMKYLIAATPDGRICYVSQGHRGGMSDAHMLTTCGFLDVVPKNCTVITTRSFKGVGQVLSEKAVTLICLPPESHQYPPPPLTKGMQSLLNLRAPVDRIIRKIKQFRHLAPHAAVNEYFATFLDQAVITACGLINLQTFEVSENFKALKQTKLTVQQKIM